MKKRRAIFVLLGITIMMMLLAAGCATAPEPQTEETVDENTTEAETKTTSDTEEDEKPEAEYTRAKNLRELIGKYGASEYAKEQFDTAESEFKKGETAYGTYNSTAKTAFEKAIEGYEFVIEKAFTKVSRKDQADEYKELADDLKASVAMKTEYEAAVAKYNAAVKAEDDGDYEKAGILFAELESMFKSIYEKTKEKKERAEESLGVLDKELDEFEKLAKESEGEINETENNGD